MSAIYLPGPPPPGAPAPNYTPNSIQFGLTAGAGDITLNANTNGASNFTSITILNPTASDVTATIQSTNPKTFTVVAGTSESFDGSFSKVILHGTAAGQTVLALQYDPTVK